jgi:hypothetical protein
MLVLAALLLVLAPADGPTVPLAGRVVDASDHPVAGAEVFFVGVADGSSAVPIVVRAATDGDGRFSLNRPADLVGDGSWRSPRLWVSAPGHRLVRQTYPDELPPPGNVLEIGLPPDGHTQVRVEDPTGRPVAGARVRIQGRLAGLDPPEAIASRLEAKTDADGMAQFDALAAEEVGRVEVEADGFGQQSRYDDPPLTGLKTFVLRESARVVGRFVAHNGRSLRGWKVGATSRAPADASGRSLLSGRADLVPLDDDGSFRIPAIATGSLDLWITWPGDDDPDLMSDWPASMQVQAGSDNRVEIPMRPAARVEGQVRERGTGRPLAGVPVHVRRAGETGGRNHLTDAEGVFRVYSLPGKVELWVDNPPRTHAAPGIGARLEVDVPPAPRHADVPPIELIPVGPPLRGVVRSADGMPLAGQRISASWSIDNGLHPITGSDWTYTRHDGRFALPAVPAGASVQLRIESAEEVQGALAQGGQQREMEVVVRMRPSIVFEGRVVDSSGAPIPRAAVSLRVHTQRENGPDFWSGLGFGDGLDRWVHTDAEGRFRTSAAVWPADAVEIQAETAAEGFLTRSSSPVPVTPSAEVRLPDVTLQRDAGIAVVSGRVLDASGAPVADARVFQRGDGPRPTQCRTDVEGRFQLPGVAGGRAVVFAEAKGFRLGGVIVGPGVDPEIRLDRVGAVLNPPPSSSPAAPGLSRAEERAMGLALLDALLESGTLAEVEAYQENRPELTLARLDPARVMERLEARSLANPVPVLVQIALNRFETDPEAAFRTLDADASGQARRQGLLALADLAATIAPERRADCLDRALAEARAGKDAESQLLLMGEVADRWLESYDLEKACAIANEGRLILDGAKEEVYAYQVAPFGEVLSIVDRPASLAFVGRRASGGSDGEDVRMRDRGAIAMRLAQADPEAAEALARELKSVPNFNEVPDYLLRIARNMARTDPEQARKVLSLLDAPDLIGTNAAHGPLPAYGLALMADARSGVDPEGARALLDEALDALRAQADLNPDRPTSPPVPAMIADLLPLVERIEPERVRERAWLALACRPSREANLDPSTALGLLQLAAALAPHDRELASVVYEPVDRAWPDLMGPRLMGPSLLQMTYEADPLALVAAYDPRALAALVDHLPDAPPKGSGNRFGAGRLDVKSRARLAGARLLGVPPAARWAEALPGRFGTWPVKGNMRWKRW